METLLNVPHRDLTILEELQDLQAIRMTDDLDDVGGLGKARRIDRPYQLLRRHKIVS
jgi:hypothetical protein